MASLTAFVEARASCAALRSSLQGVVLDDAAALVDEVVLDDAAALVDEVVLDDAAALVDDEFVGPEITTAMVILTTKAPTA